MSRKNLVVMLIVFFVTVMVTVSVVTAQTPAASGVTLPYSGQLADSSGQAVSDGLYDFIFTLYPSEKNGPVLWTEIQTGVNVKSGSMNVVLGQNMPMTKELADRQGLWLSVSVRGPQDGEFILLNPRIDMNSTKEVSTLTCPHNHFTDYWPGESSDWGLLIENMSTGDGLRAYSKSTTWNYAAVFGANIAATGYGTGVYGFSDKGVGVYANSNSGDGLEATTASNIKSAVYGHSVDGNGIWGISTNRQGVHGGSTNNFGVEATGGGDASYSDLLGDLLIGGTRGEIFSFGNVMELFSNGYIALDLDNDNNSANQFEIWNGTETLVYKVDESGNTTAIGTKSASVNTPNFGQRLMYSVESPEVWFEDIGTAHLENGVAMVKFETIFAETVNASLDYHVFVTPLCEYAVILFVSEKTEEGFTVKGETLDKQPSNCGFDYRVIAKRLGYEDDRLMPVDTTANSRP